MTEIREFVGSIGLVDLICVLLIVGSVIGGLKRGSLIAAVGSGLGTAVVVWLIAGALVAWGPTGAADAVSGSALLSLVPPPAAALGEAGQLVRGLFSGSA